MAWTAPEYSRRQVDEAGRVLATEAADIFAMTRALDVLNNWRSSHSFPLNTVQMGLRNKARQVADDVLIAQRLKRVPSIIQKLRRFPTMNLARMQDIGGCRAVLSSVADVHRVRESFRSSRMKHVLANEKDYIEEPKASGYRGIHLVYKYRSDRNDTYNGLQIEVQIRSQLQHAWATAVETVGTFLQQSLKASQGSDQWLRFFELMGSAFALKEGTPLVPGTPGDPGVLILAIRDYVAELQVQDRLQAYGLALQTLDEGLQRGDHYFLLALRPSLGTLDITGYARAELQRATNEYLRVEKEISELPGAEAVLVSVESLDLLRKAYPNYFLDTQVFLSELNGLLQTDGLKPNAVML